MDHKKFLTILTTEMDALERQVEQLSEGAEDALNIEQLHSLEADPTEKHKALEAHRFRIKMLKQKLDMYKTQLMSLQTELLNEELETMGEALNAPL